VNERRQENRIPKELFLRFGPEGTETEHAGLGEDFSRSGLYIQSQTLFPIQTEIKIVLHLPDAGTLVVLGQVAWVKDLPQDTDHPASRGMGIRLAQIPEAYQVLLSALQ